LHSERHRIDGCCTAKRKQIKNTPPPQLLQYPLVSGLTVRSGTDWKRVAAPVGNAEAANKTAAINFAQFVPHVAQIVANRDMTLLLFRKIELDLDENVKDQKNITKSDASRAFLFDVLAMISTPCGP